MTLSSSVKNFLLESFWLPIVDEAVYYNPYNTVVYSVIFAAAAIYLGYPMLKRLDITLDRSFFIGISPFVFLGGFLRSLKDINVVNTILVETPFIYILMFVFTVSAVAVSLKVEELKDTAYHKTLFGVGITALLILVPFYSVNNPSLIYMFIFVSALWMVTGYLVLKTFKPDLINAGFTLPIAAHFFDATSTYIGIEMAGASEKHVLADFFIQSYGTWTIFLVKAGIIIPVVYIIYSDMEGEKRNYYLFLVALLGFAIATRNMLSII